MSLSAINYRLILSSATLFSVLAASLSAQGLEIPTRELTNYTYRFLETGPIQGNCTYYAENVTIYFLGKKTQSVLVQSPCNLQIEKQDTEKLRVEIGGEWAPGEPVQVQSIYLENELIWQRAK